MKPKVKNKLKKLRQQKILKQQEQDAAEKRYNQLFKPNHFEKEFVEYKPEQTYRRGDASHIPSKSLEVHVEAKQEPRYTGDMLEREIEAQKEIKRKKKRVGVLCNKSGYQYITDDFDLKDMGK